MTTSRPVELRVGGQNYRVVSSASRDELERFAAIVDEKLNPHVLPGRPLHPNALLLVALALAHELETEKERLGRVTARAKETVEKMIFRVDEAMALTDRALGDLAVGEQAQDREGLETLQFDDSGDAD